LKQKVATENCYLFWWLIYVRFSGVNVIALCIVYDMIWNLLYVSVRWQWRGL